MNYGRRSATISPLERRTLPNGLPPRPPVGSRKGLRAALKAGRLHVYSDQRAGTECESGFSRKSAATGGRGPQRSPQGKCCESEDYKIQARVTKISLLRGLCGLVLSDYHSKWDRLQFALTRWAEGSRVQ